ncbi:MAG TPA: prolipoprotein diacylglyceryl transferase [Gemmatimonadaceae bacterium]|nr:prolipoprotein diacylglyceryl transferase [Gemmatimonadaceae bacterium]
MIHHPFKIPIYGSISLSGFGIAMVLAFLIAQYASETEMERRGYNKAPFADITLAAVIGGLLGAKLYYVILTGASPFSREGFVFFGGLMGGLIACGLVVWHYKLGYFRMGDLTAPGLAAAYAVGRTGCWAVGDDYGGPTNSFVGVAFPQGAPPSTPANLHSFGVSVPSNLPPNDAIPVHPTQIYEVILACLMFGILWRLRNHKHAAGWLFGVYFMLVGIERFTIEFFRAKDDRFLGPFTVAQAIAAAFFMSGLILVNVFRTPGPNRPGIFADGSSPA